MIDRIEEARERLGRAQGRLHRRLLRQREELRQALHASETEEAALLKERLPELPESFALTGSQYLRATRELRVLWQELLAAEERLDRSRRHARAALRQAAALLAETVPDEAPRFAALLAEVPLDASMGERIEALVCLLRTRLRVVPRLMAIQPQWKR